MMKQDHSLTNWVEAYTNDLYSWALHKVSNTELAQDLVQDTFLAAAEKIENFKGESTPKTWLFAILNHKIIDVYRKKVKQPINVDNQTFSQFFNETGEWQSSKIPQDWNEAEKNLLDDDEFQAVLSNCLDALPETWNMCMKLKYLSGKKGEEICQEIGITISNYWQIVHRAKLQLRNCVEHNWFKN